MRLRVSISNCFINAYSSLASCRFESADIRKLEENTFATCDCESERRCYYNRQHCDVSPYLCINTSADPGSCEDCFNGIDDDGNGILDCEDPNCSPSFDCGTLGSSTTATCPPSTTLQATTTSMPAAAMESLLPSGDPMRPRHRAADADLIAR